MARAIFASVDGTQQSIGVVSSQKERCPRHARSTKWVKLNAGQAFTRQVPDAMLPHLFEAISSKNCRPRTIGLLSDARRCRAGLGPTGASWSCWAYKNEDDATGLAAGEAQESARGGALGGLRGFARSLIVRPGAAGRRATGRAPGAEVEREVIAAYRRSRRGPAASTPRRRGATARAGDAALPSEYQSAVYAGACAGGQETPTSFSN